MPYQAKCTFTSAPLGVGSLPDVGFAKCQDPSIIWSLRRVIAGNGAAPVYELALADADQSLAAAKFFPASEFPIIRDGSSYHQTFTGDGRFIVQ